ncbi:MAG: nucleotidyltransferase domain-containing protein [Pseudomonadales bacterium]|nr:nucleotidyltransferase domain-containing protein [Pseudomonadales bacterium]
MTNLPPILPDGTQVVTHVDILASSGNVLFAEGAVGVIVKAPVDTTHAYRVRFMDGSEHSLKREDFSVRSHHQNPTVQGDHLAGVDLYEYVIYRCVVGSRAYGLDHEESDLDLRGIYLPPADLHWSLFGIPEQLERGEEAYWELQKFIVLALKANPNLLECLYTPLIEHVDPVAQELLDMRHIFMSKLIYQTYNGYVMSQFRKLQKDIENHGQIRWKHAMHLIRLLLSGIIALQEGEIPVRVPDAYRDRLLSIRFGETAWDDVNQWRLTLHKEFDAAFQSTNLPDRPDYEAANAFLVRARRQAL